MRWLLALSLWLLPALGSAQTINVSLSASRTSGAAPLYVFFDAGGTTCTGNAQCSIANGSGGAFRNLDYSWSFGDTGSSGTGNYSWGALGEPRNTSIGPEAGHVYDEGGTFTVTLTVRGPDGAVATATQQITVTSESAQWAGTDTRCYSTSGNFTDCPAGATQVTSSSFSGAETLCDVPDRRCLFRAGETFTMSGSWFLDFNGPGLIGSYGSANSGRAIVNAPTPQTGSGQPMFFVRGAGGSNPVSDWRIRDLELSGPGAVFGATGQGPSVFNVQRRFTNILMQNTLAQPGEWHAGVIIAAQPLNGAGDDIPDGFGFFDNDWRDFGYGGGGNIFFTAMQRIAIVGNRIYDSVGGEHNVRLQHTERGVIYSNTMGDQRPSKGVIDQRSRDQCPGGVCSPATCQNASPCTIAQCPSACGRPTQKVLIARNDISLDRPGAASGGINATGSEDIFTSTQGEDIIVEANFIHPIPGMTEELEIQNAFITATTRRIALRNNVIWAHRWMETNGFSLGKTPTPASGSGGTTADLAAYGNTLYQQIPPFVRPVRMFRGGFAYRFNNLLWAPGNSGAIVTIMEEDANLGDGVAGNDIAAPNNTPFVSTAPSSIAQFALKSGAVQINAGISSGASLGSQASPAPTLAVGLYNPRDFTGAFRTGAPDIGAFEFGSTVTPPTTCSPDPTCNDSNQCTDDACVSGSCVNTSRVGQSCNDGNSATSPDTCQSNLTCSGPTATCSPACNDGNACTVDTCTVTTCSFPAVANGTSCDDGNANTGGDMCQSGACAGTQSTTDLAINQIQIFRADTDALLTNLTTGQTSAVLDRANGITPCATASGADTLGSIRLAILGPGGASVLNAVETFAPYCNTDAGAGSYIASPAFTTTGPYTLTATPYTGSNGTGIAGTPATVTLVVTDSSIPAPPAPATIFVRGASGGVSIP
jgi:hypothetical protein